MIIRKTDEFMLSTIHKSYNIENKEDEIELIKYIIESVVYKKEAVTKIASQFNVTTPTIYKILKDNNYKLKEKKENEK